MLILEILSLAFKMVRSKTTETFQVIRYKKELSIKKQTLEKGFAAIGSAALYLKDGSGQFQNLRNQVERAETAIVRMKSQMQADRMKRNALQQELKRIRAGFFDTTPRVIGLRRQLASLRDSGGAGRQRRMLESELKTLWMRLGRQAFLEKISPGILGGPYQATQKTIEQISRLEQDINRVKTEGNAQRQAMQEMIKVKAGGIFINFK